MAFKEVFNQLLDSRGWKQADFARITGMSTAYVSHMAIGKVRDPSFEKACIVADAFGITLEELRMMIVESEKVDD